ncbi:MAG: nicotinate (nicotinamide) nucleotide adenylyltransferase [Formivibrio sp.]|nr:nicotinate (nicotinamide) nucleotide adenylyltransferase [Formivibrio sp.]
MKTIGIFGGSFDPVHFGHIALARGLCDAFALDEVRLIPTGEPPHRDALSVSAELRLEWVRQALTNETALVADDREVRRDGLCYTIDTLTEIQHENPDALLVWLIGGDSFLNLDKWRRWRELLEAGHLAIAARPGFDLGALPQEIAAEYAVRAVSASPGSLGKGRISVLPMPLLPFSSTDIRAKLAKGEDVSALTPVAAQLRSAGYYR